MADTHAAFDAPGADGPFKVSHFSYSFDDFKITAMVHGNAR